MAPSCFHSLGLQVRICIHAWSNTVSSASEFSSLCGAMWHKKTNNIRAGVSEPETSCAEPSTWTRVRRAWTATGPTRASSVAWWWSCSRLSPSSWPLCSLNRWPMIILKQVVIFQHWWPLCQTWYFTLWLRLLCSLEHVKSG